MSEFETLSHELEKSTKELAAATAAFQSDVAQSRAELNELFAKADTALEDFVTTLGDTSDLDEKAND